MSVKSIVPKEISPEWEDYLVKEAATLDNKTISIFARRLGTLANTAALYNTHGSIQFDNIIKRRVNVLLKYLKDNDVPRLDSTKKRSVMTRLKRGSFQDITSACSTIVGAIKKSMSSQPEKQTLLVTLLSWAEWMEYIIADVSLGQSNQQSIGFYDFINYIKMLDLKWLRRMDLQENINNISASADRIDEFKLANIFPVCILIDEYMTALMRSFCRKKYFLVK